MRFELYAVGAASPDAVWAVVGDPRRLPGWTDADEVVSVDPEPLEVGSQIVVTVEGRQQRWRLVTVEPRLVEARREQPRDPVAVGVRVVPDPRGSRIVLAGSVPPSGTFGALWARLFAAPALRRRMDRWAATAVQVAQENG